MEIFADFSQVFLVAASINGRLSDSFLVPIWICSPNRDDYSPGMVCFDFFPKRNVALLAVLFCLSGPQANGQKEPAVLIAELRNAADQGDANAQYNLGVAYSLGHAVPQSDKEARILWRKAADQGHATAQDNLGLYYFSGRGVTQNYAEAAILFRKAADQGFMNSQYNLGLCYYSGHGVASDKLAAVRWWLKAANQQYAPAQCNLGVCYTKGEGVAKNEVEGYKWELLAAAQGYALAKAHVVEVERYLSPAQRAEGQRLAQEWLASHANRGESNKP